MYSFLNMEILYILLGYRYVLRARGIQIGMRNTEICNVAVSLGEWAKELQSEMAAERFNYMCCTYDARYGGHMACILASSKFLIPDVLH